MKWGTSRTKYVQHPGGWDNGDEVAVMLRGKTREECLAICEGYTGENLTERYAELSDGMVRANCGNRIRGHLRR